MSLPRIRDEWHVPARYGARVYCPNLDQHGTVTGEHDGHVRVTFDNQATIYIHPDDLDWA